MARTKRRVAARLPEGIKEIPATRAAQLFRWNRALIALHGIVDFRTGQVKLHIDPGIDRLLPDPLARKVKLADLEDNMDIRRMIGVTPKDMERLARYRKAWAELQVPTAG